VTRRAISGVVKNELLYNIMLSLLLLVVVVYTYQQRKTGPIVFGKHIINVTRPAKTGFIGTNYIPSHNRSHLSSRPKQLLICNL